MKPLRLGFAGTPDFAAIHLAALLESHHKVATVLTQPDRRAGRGKQARPGPVKALASSRAVPVLQPPSLKAPEPQAQLRELELDALIVVAYGLLLPQAVLDMPGYGCLNVHGSLLPRWRGAAPIQRAIEAGDRESGVTIMSMDAGLDTGPMLAHGPCDIPPLCTSGDLYGRLATLGPPLLLSVLDDLPGHLERATVQNNAHATHAAKIQKSEALLDWTENPVVLARRIRAFNPAPGCYSFLGDQRVKIWGATPGPGTGTADSEPGQILSARGEGITVRCGDGTLALHTLQFPGAKALPAAEIIRGRSGLITQGSSFRDTPVS